MPSRRRPLLLAVVVTALIAVAHLRPAPALLDAATGLPLSGVRLEVPWGHLVLTPWAALGDIAACSSLAQAFSLLGLLAAFLAPLRWALGHDHDWFAFGPATRALALHALACVTLLAWGVLWPRPPARLAIDDPDLMAVDFHSHTNASWDGRSWFDPAANLRWHERAGFAAAFVTDHNRMDGAISARRHSDNSWAAGRRELAAGLEGEELSLHGAHVLLLGPDRPVAPQAYPGLEGLRLLLKDAGPLFGAVTVMSLPEYYQHHEKRLETLADWGAGGFEIVAASPRGLGVPAAFRRDVVELCRRRGLFVTGGSDNHGYGSTNCVWNLVRVPGWRALDPAQRSRAVLAELRQGGFSAVRVLARARCLARPRSVTEAWLDAPRALWWALRSWSLAQALSAVAWVWAAAAVCSVASNNKVV